ncbi:MAG TPA: hypothetical protein VNK23_14470 [Candidatus Dormibacteraeota bacterium]|nr:hypothetical protein [Candidatus Dormibacteraeota bacterium]
MSKRTSLRLGAILIFSVILFLTAGTARVAAQGPAGSGAAAAAQDSSRSMNPMKWLKKDPDSTQPAANRPDIEKKLTPKLRASGLLSPAATATDACASFTELDDCLAVLHASHNLEVNFDCLRAVVSGVHTSTNLSGCKAVDEDKPVSLSKAIRLFKPDANGKREAKNAEQQAAGDLGAVGE